jgi:type I restriction enzyme, S subunit
MTNGWQTVQLGDVLRRVKSELAIEESVTYKQVTVRLWNKGVFLRGEQEGSNIKTKRQFYVKTGQLLMSRIDVRNGAIGLVPKELDGAIVSNDFWVYDFDKNQIHPEFFANYVKTPGFIEDANRTSSGTTKRIRAEENAFLNINIPLPPLTEQRRTVAHIESLAARVHEVQRLREEAREGTEALLHSSMRQIFKLDGAKIVALETTCAAIIDNLHSNPDYSGDCVVPCIRSSDVGWGELFLETARRTSEAEYIHRTIRGEPTENDIVLVREGGGTGKAAIVEKHHRFSLGQRVMMLRPDKSVVLPKFLLYQILSPFIYDEQILPLSKGSASPHLNIGALRKFKFVLPPLDEQRRIVAYLDGLQAKVNALRELQAESGKELSALMPSILDKAFRGEL